MEAVHRYEGTVNQVMGDGIMALFGAPVAHEDHAVRGVLKTTSRAYIDAYQGRFDEAIPRLERALREAEVHGLAMINTVSSVLGAALAGAGRTVEGLALLARGVRGQEPIGNRFHLARRYGSGLIPCSWRASCRTRSGPPTRP